MKENEHLRQTGRTTRIIAEFLALHENYDFDRVLVVGHRYKKSGNLLKERIINSAMLVKEDPVEKAQYVYNLPELVCCGIKDYIHHLSDIDYVVKDHPMP